MKNWSNSNGSRCSKKVNHSPEGEEEKSVAVGRFKVDANPSNQFPLHFIHAGTVRNRQGCGLPSSLKGLMELGIGQSMTKQPGCEVDRPRRQPDKPYLLTASDRWYTVAFYYEAVPIPFHRTLLALKRT